MVAKKVAIPTIFICAAVLGVYFTYFHKPPTEDIISANKRKLNSLSKQALHGEHSKLKQPDEDYADYEDDPAKATKMLWDRWVIENDFASIGVIYDKCEGDDRLTVGQVIMLPDKKKGGVTSRSYMNYSLAVDVDEGAEIKISVQYNGKDLYSNHFDFCTIDDTDPPEERLIYCPVKKGPKFWKKDMKIPNYLPRGDYYATGEVTMDGATLACGEAKFTL